MIKKTQPPRVDQDRFLSDTGCIYSPTCLACPLPVCKEDAPNLAASYHLIGRIKRRHLAGLAAVS